MDEYEKIMKNKKRKVCSVFEWIGLMILFLLPLSGCVISGIYQIIVQQETYGVFSEMIHIWGLYDLWNLTLLGYIPWVILLER